MNSARLAAILADVERGHRSVDDALRELRVFPTENLHYARVDHARDLRQGFPEVVLCEGKTVDQVVGICEALHRENGSFLATRASREMQVALQGRFPGTEINELARTAYRTPDGPLDVIGVGTILVISAGTSDLPVAEEAAVVARAMRNRVECLYDVGVAGIHRVLAKSAILDEAAVIIVVAGMDGALASVVGGIVRSPVIAVPTSVGYGASFGGLSALLAMLNSCASGVTVVNIDNGFGAAAAAARINRPR